jgi:precorrin-8X/cobalt-precorrin-8 methylmutase
VIAYLKDPKEIYARSFDTIRAETNLSRFDGRDRALVTRIIHACGMTDIVDDLRLTAGVSDAIADALRRGASVLADSEMTADGLIRSKLPKNCEIVCTLNDDRARRIGIETGTTRSAAAISLWRDRVEGAIAVIGNAPTALFALLELLDTGTPKPAAIIAFPVGFVGAAESKEELIRDPRGVPFVTLLGRRGGSAMAAAAVNACAELV